MFAFFVAAAALCAFQAWSSSARWTRFWCFSALSTLTKGPLGVVLAANGLLASVWQARSGKPMPIRGRHLRGICIFALLTMGWFGLAFTRFGHELVDKMIWSELFGHATGAGKAALPLVEGYKPPLYFLSRFAPWSVFACIGLWRVLKRPATHRDERAFERFLVCWFGIGLLLFSCAAHHRADLLYPLVPPAALLAGREIDRLLAGWKAGSFRLAVATASLAVVSLAYCNYHLFPRYTPQLQQIELAVDGDDEGGESSTVNVENWM
jgi:4-amino-4-deoxy-L-arabinose transferase-like glycosyltransferase